MCTDDSLDHVVALPSSDGLACFNRMYLDVTQQVNDWIGQGFFANAGFMAHLDVVFANIYFTVRRARVRLDRSMSEATSASRRFRPWSPSTQT